MGPTLQSRKAQNPSFTLPVDGINQIACLPNLKLNSVDVFNMRKTSPYGLDEFQAYTNPIFQNFDEEDNDYDSSDSSPTSPRDLLFSQVETESYDTVVMPTMVTEAINLEEELATMKATVERLSKECGERMFKSSVKISKLMI